MSKQEKRAAAPTGAKVATGLAGAAKPIAGATRRGRPAGELRDAVRATLPGYTLFLIWFEGTKSFDVGSAAADPASMFSLCLMAADLVALVAIGCLYRRVVSLQRRRRLLAVTASVIAVATAGLLVPSLGGSVPVGLAGAFGLGMGAAKAVLTLAWMESFCRYGMRDACICFACSTVVGTTLSSLVGAILPGAANVVVAAAAGIASALTVPREPEGDLVGRPVEEPDEAGPGEKPGGCPVGHWSFPLQPCLLMGVFAVATLLVGNLAGPAGADPTPRGTPGILAALFLLAMVLKSFDQLDIRILSSVALPLGCLGLLGTLSLFRDSGIPAAFAASLAYQCFSTFTYVLLFNISYRYGVNPLWLFGFSRAPRIAAAIVIPSLTGTGVLVASSTGADAVLAATLVVLVAASSLCTVGKSFDTTWGIKPRGDGRDGEGAAGTPAMPLEERCRRAAFVYNLTRREEEVLVLLLRGMSTPDIERELSISNGTARNHVQHVYKKFDVHSRDELQERMATEVSAR